MWLYEAKQGFRIAGTSEKEKTANKKQQFQQNNKKEAKENSI